MFNFGNNWKNYSKKITEKDFEAAKNSLIDLFDVGTLCSKKFIDIGCGSGLFSIAAKKLGAKEVLGLDILKSSVECSIKNAQKFNEANIEFKKMSILDPKIKNLKKYDIVYAWGSLHHTGRMWEAIENSMKLVDNDGLLMISIYNKNITSFLWKIEKYIYVHSFWLIKKMIEFFYFLLIIPLKILIFRGSFFREKRGMKIYYDAIDWLGGYPYEYASKKEIVNFMQKKNFRLIKFIPTVGISGTNQFVFKKIN